MKVRRSFVQALDLGRLVEVAAFFVRPTRVTGLLVALLQAPGGPATAASAPAEPGAPRAEARAPRPFDLYLGLEPRRVRSRSRVEGGRGRQVFEPVLQGDRVEHDFLISNPSDEVLEIRDLKMCSGCIVDGYSKTIRPGQEGRISMVVPTDWLGGREISGVITAETSVPEMPRIEIEVSLAVREFAALSPYRVWLKGSPETPIVEKCLIVPNEAYPFSITGIKARKGVWFRHSWRELERDGRTAYEITIENTRRKPGPYQDVLFVQTDHPERPELKIRIEGRIEE